MVTDALSQYLQDPVWVLKQFPNNDEGVAVQQIISAATDLAGRLKSAVTDPDVRELIKVLAKRIVVGDGIVTIDVCQNGLMQLLRLAVPSFSHVASSLDDAGADSTVPIVFATKRLRCGKQVKMIVGDVETSKRSVNAELVKIVSDAHRWFEGLKSGRYRTIAEIADKEDRQVSDVSRSISLAFLAPDIIQMILDGRQPITMTPERLKANRPLLLDWDEQRQVLLSSS